MTPRTPSVSAVSPPARVAAAALRVLSRASFPFLLVALVRAIDPPLTPFVLAQGLFALALVPELCARLVLRAYAAEVRVADGALQSDGALARVAAPLAALGEARPWRLPLPSAGVTLRLRAGGRLVGLASAAPAALLGVLAQAGAGAPPSATLLWAEARAAWRRRWWGHPLVAIGLASLLPGGVGFYAHQHIAFGGLLGEYYLMGLGAWLATAARYFGTGLVYLALWWGCFRVALEILTWLAAQAAPSSTPKMRSAAERSAALLYYASIPALLALRFLA
jgi:apolipoprotein N-acyltransferase